MLLEKSYNRLNLEGYFLNTVSLHEWAKFPIAITLGYRIAGNFHKGKFSPKAIV